MNSNNTISYTVIGAFGAFIPSLFPTIGGDWFCTTLLTSAGALGGAICCAKSEILDNNLSLNYLADVTVGIGTYLLTKDASLAITASVFCAALDTIHYGIEIFSDDMKDIQTIEDL
jgi:hypothetical protein